MKTRLEQVNGPFPGKSRLQTGAAGSTLLVLLIIGIALWYFRPWESFLPSPSRPEAVPRPVAARGTLAEDEQNNITWAQELEHHGVQHHRYQGQGHGVEGVRAGAASQ